ncbi:MAG: type VI secretion system baseplate subunit TssG [Ferruginibacter sp.]
MKQQRFSDTLANLEIDFKAEVVAAEMVENGLNAEQIMIVLLGPKKRTFSKDVEDISEELSDYNHKEYTLVKTHKEGIYDMLPEGLFHTPAAPKSVTTDREVVNFIKQQRIEERNARRFFLPYEAAINHLRIQMALYENRLDKGAHYNELVNIFSDHWEIFRYLDNNQSNIFLQLLPLIHDIRDDYRVAETIFELIFGLPVKVEAVPQRLFQSDAPVYSTLKDAVLGVNFTTGNEVYITGEDELSVIVGPIDNQQLKLFASGTRNNKILELLCDYLLPAHLEVSVDFELYDLDKTTRLADKENDYNSTLGLSTYL